MPQRITWPMVVVIGLVLTAVTLLAVLDADTQVITNVLLALGLGGGLGVLTGIKNNVNGTQIEMLRAIRDALDKLSKAPAIEENHDPKE